MLTIKYEVENINILKILSKYFITVCFLQKAVIVITLNGYIYGNKKFVFRST